MELKICRKKIKIVQARFRKISSRNGTIFKGAKTRKCWKKNLRDGARKRPRVLAANMMLGTTIENLKKARRAIDKFFINRYYI